MPEAHGLPYVDEHTTTIAAPRDVVWAAVARYARSTLTTAAGGVPGRLLGTDPPGGFEVVEEVPGARLALAGRHRFSRYRLDFELTDGSGGVGLTARSYAEFPGLAGATYRALVIGTRFHVLAVRRMLADIRRLSTTGRSATTGDLSYASRDSIHNGSPTSKVVDEVDRRQMMAATTAGLVGTVAGAALGAEPAAAAQPAETAGDLRLGHIRLVSLSHVNDPAVTPLFPGDPAFTLTTAFTIPTDGFYLQYVQEGEHTGSHWGAPGHFEEGGLLADQLDPNDLLLPAVKIDIREKSARDADYELTVADLVAWEKRYGRIPQECAVVLWTGWGEKWGTPAYANLDADGVIHQPGFGIESVQWLVDRGNLGRRGSLGSDTFGADPGIDDTFAASTLLFHHHRISLENMANLHLLPTTGAWVLPGGPINRRGSGSPAHILGLIPR